MTTTAPTQYDTSFIDWQDEVERMLETLEEKIQEGVDWVLDQWDGSILDSWLKYTSPAAYAAGKYALSRLEDAIQRIWDEFERILPEVWEQVRRLFATPWGLMDLSERYSEAAGALRDEEIAVERLTRHLQKGWSGDAAAAYAGVAAEQKNAILAVNTGLTSASSACATGARPVGHPRRRPCHQGDRRGRDRGAAPGQRAARFLGRQHHRQPRRVDRSQRRPGGPALGQRVARHRFLRPRRRP